MTLVFKFQYIEERFSLKSLRLVTVLVNLASSILFMGFLLYLPSILSENFTYLDRRESAVVIGLLCGVYSAFVSTV